MGTGAVFPNEASARLPSGGVRHVMFLAGAANGPEQNDGVSVFSRAAPPSSTLTRHNRTSQRGSERTLTGVQLQLANGNWVNLGRPRYDEPRMPGGAAWGEIPPDAESLASRHSRAVPAPALASGSSAPELRLP
jgi:hypothetical protein